VRSHNGLLTLHLALRNAAVLCYQSLSSFVDPGRGVAGCRPYLTSLGFLQEAMPPLPLSLADRSSQVSHGTSHPSNACRTPSLSSEFLP